MKIIRDLREIKRPIKNTVITIGVFDGMHLGHKHIIEKTVNRARWTGRKSMVVTFEPHPLKVLKAASYVPTLISLEHRIRLIEEMGVDYLVILKFTKSFSRTMPGRFVKETLIDKLGLKEIFIGEDFYFGRGANAGPNSMKILAEDYGFRLKIVKPVMRLASLVSSSLIRSLILSGDIKRAAKLLGRPVSILGTVVKGARRGRILGFRTANVNPHHEVVPPSGVWAVTVKARKKIFGGVVNIGLRPTFYKKTKDLEPTIEVHIFGFDEDIYGEDIEIFFIEKIRDEAEFKDRDELARQIRDDAVKAKSITDIRLRQ